MKEKRCSTPWTPGEGPVRLRVVVGEGHMGEIQVFLDEELMAEGSDEIEGLRLGTADALRGHEVVVTALINPTPGGGSRASLTSTFRDDVEAFEHSCVVSEHGGDEVYIRSKYPCRDRGDDGA